jgi:hypothetical protein
MSEPEITIVGGGLSAIYAYWGCIDAGYLPQEIEVLYTSRNLPVGAVFMYESPILWPTTDITSILLGTCDQYAINQWGQRRLTSAHRRFRNGQEPSVIEPLYMLEEMRSTLWDLIPRKQQTPLLLSNELQDLKKWRKAVICTFANERYSKSYKDQKYVIPLPIYANTIYNNKHIVLYNGLENIPWVRRTLIPGKIFSEYPTWAEEFMILHYEETECANRDGKLHYVPDLNPDCPALSWNESIEDNLLRVGRFARFSPGYLSHQARADTTRFLGELS